jgi:choline dehydrogenase-like flavoprotein
VTRSDTTYDAFVVGSGASDSWAVKEMTEGGLKVVLFEADRNLDIAHEFPADAQVGGSGIVGRVKSVIQGQGSGTMPI